MTRAFGAGDVYPSDETRSGLGNGWPARFGAGSALGWDGRWADEPIPPPSPRDAQLIDVAESWLRQASIGPYPDPTLMRALAMAMAMAPHHHSLKDAHHDRVDQLLKQSRVNHAAVGRAMKDVKGLHGEHRSADLDGAADRIERVFRHGHQEEYERRHGRNFRAWVMRHDETHNLRRDLVSLAIQLCGMDDVGAVDSQAIAFVTGNRSPKLLELANAKEGFYRHIEDRLRHLAHHHVKRGTRYAFLAAAAWCAAGCPSPRRLWSLLGAERQDANLLAEGILYSMSRLGGGATAIGIANIFGGQLASSNEGELTMPPANAEGGEA